MEVEAPRAVEAPSPRRRVPSGPGQTPAPPAGRRLQRRSVRSDAKTVRPSFVADAHGEQRRHSGGSTSRRQSAPNSPIPHAHRRLIQIEINDQCRREISRWIPARRQSTKWPSARPLTLDRHISGPADEDRAPFDLVSSPWRLQFPSPEATPQLVADRTATDENLHSL